MPPFASKINRSLALTEADRDANEALARGETPCLVVDADFFTKLGAGVSISSAQTIVVGEAIEVEEWLPRATGRSVLYAVEHAQDGLALIEWLTDQGFKNQGIGEPTSVRYTHMTIESRRETIEHALLEQTFNGYEKFWDPGSHQDFVNLDPGPLSHSSVVRKCRGGRVLPRQQRVGDARLRGE